MHYKININFVSPIYGEIDNIKLANALLKIIAENNDEEKEVFLKSIKENNFRISSPLNKDKFSSLISDKKETLKYMNNIEEISEKINHLKNDPKKVKEQIKEVLEKLKEIKRIRKEGRKNKHKDNKEDLVDIPQQTVYTKTSINRKSLRALEANLYRHQVKYVKDTLSIYLYINKEEVKEIIEKSFQKLELSGISKRRTIGYGRFKIIKQNNNILNPIDPEKEFEDEINIIQEEYHILLGKQLYSPDIKTYYKIEEPLYDVKPFYGRFENGKYFGNMLLLKEKASLKPNKNKGPIPNKILFEETHHKIIFAPYILEIK